MIYSHPAPSCLSISGLGTYCSERKVSHKLDVKCYISLGQSRHFSFLQVSSVIPSECADCIIATIDHWLSICGMLCAWVHCVHLPILSSQQSEEGSSYGSQGSCRVVLKLTSFFFLFCFCYCFFWLCFVFVCFFCFCLFVLRQDFSMYPWLS